MSNVKNMGNPLDSAKVTTAGNLGDGLSTNRSARTATEALAQGLPSPGTKFGGADGCRFELVEMLGRGGMGAVFLARDHLLERRVAMKFLAKQDEDSRGEVVALLREEARAAARLNHEAIVRVFDLETYNGRPFLVMEYVEGQALSSIAERGEFDALRATRIVADVARGLVHAHHIGIIHCDLKPSNIFLAKDGHAKILDFGLARIFRTQEALTTSDSSSHSGAIAGTPVYMSPEQWRGEPLDGRSDLWALGIIFFELLAGKIPVDERELPVIRERLTSPEPLPSVRDLRPDLPTEADAIIARALSKDVAKRFGTADEFLDALVGLEVLLSHSLRSTADEDAGAQSVRRVSQRQMSLASFGFTNITSSGEQLDAEAIAGLLTELFDVSRTVVRQLEGMSMISVGGRVLAYFGYPVAHEDDGQRAIRAALLVSAAVRNLERQSGFAVGVKIGIHTGAVLVGKEGTLADGAMLQGVVPEVAIGLERYAEPNTIVISASTAAVAGWLFDLVSLGPHTPPDSTRPIEVFRVVGQKVVTRRFEQSVLLGLTPLVGRQNEVEALNALWSQAIGGEGRFVLVSGEPGIGKSRLVEALKESVVSQGYTKLTAQCWSYFRNAAFAPLFEALQQSVGIFVTDPPAARRAKFAAFMDRLGLDPEFLPIVSTFLIPTDGAPPLNISPDMFRLRLIDSLITIFLRFASERPTLLIVEDLHWSDTSTVELLAMLLDRIADAPMLVLVTFRSEYQHMFPVRAHLHQIRLTRLPPDATAEMVGVAARDRSLPAIITAALVERTDGVPLFIEELTRVVIESWHASGQHGEATVLESSIPATLNELLLARLDRVGGVGKEVAQLAAILGRDFAFDLIQRASHLSERLLRHGLMQLVDAGLVQHQPGEAGPRYAFKHALVQEMAYRSLLKSQRQELHVRVAETLVRDFAALAEQQPELLAYHFVEGGAAAHALPYLEKAGERAVQRSAHTDAITHYRRAIELLAKLPKEADQARRELSLRLALGSPLMAVKGYANDEVEANYRRALELCQGLGDDAQFFPVTLGLWQVSMVRGHIPASVQLGLQVIAQARGANNVTSMMLARRALGTSCLLAGDLVGAREHTTAGLELYDPQQHSMLGLRFGHDPGVAHGLYRGLALWLLGYTDEGLAASQAALALAQTLKHPVSIAFALCYVSVVQLLRGEYSSARTHADEAAELSAQHHLALWLAMSKIVSGWALAGLGETEAGIDLLYNGIDGWTRTGARAGVTCFQAGLAWALLGAGRGEEALRVADDAIQTANNNGEFFFHAELLRLRGDALCKESITRTEEATAFFRQALAIARRQESRGFELRTAVSFSRLLMGNGRPEEALEILEPIHTWFTQGSGTIDVTTANSLFNELSSVV